VRQDTPQFDRDLVAAGPKLLAAARWLTRNPDEADDLVQETLVRAWRFRERFAPGTNILAWLKSILRNQHLAGLRRRRLEQRYFQHVPGADQACGAGQVASLELKEVAAAVGALENRAAAAIVMVGVQGCSYEEAATALGDTPAAFKSRLNRARRHVRAEVDSRRPLRPPEPERRSVA
jgi:RNA polymerase sigma-70 factor (ECF subfamily)